MRSPVIWFEVEDLLRYFDLTPNPSGIQRVVLEILHALGPEIGNNRDIRVCRISHHTSRFEPIDLEQLTTAYLNGPGRDAPWRWSKRWYLAIAFLPVYLNRIAAPRVRDWMIASAGRDGSDGSNLLTPGDVIICLGSSWINRKYCHRVAELKVSRKVKFVQLVHDLIPVLHPQWAHQNENFRRWLLGIVATADQILTVSHATRNDLL